MIRFPNAKINLGLRIVSRRPDGYHNLETVFYPIQLQDALELVPTTDPTTSLTLSGIVIDGDSRDNLVMKAWRRLSERFDLPPVSIHLHKAIPFGAGLGGGSADAAFLLAMVRDYFHLPLSDEELDREAAALGADCPFFLHNKPLLAKGIGDEFEPVALSLKGYRLVLVKPAVAVPTAVAYSLVTPAEPDEPVSVTIARPVAEWRDRLVNDFEKSVFARFPEVGAIKESLYEAGAVYASMSGSGSSVFGLFDREVDLADCYRNCFVWSGMCEV